MARRRKLIIQIVGQQGNLKGVLNQQSSALGKFGSVAKGAFAVVAGGAVLAGTAIAGGLAVSIKAFGDFDQAMQESIAIMGDVSGPQRKKMEDAARSIGRTTKFSATEAAGAFYFLASAGLDVNQSIEALPVTAQFAQAGLMDLESATEDLVSIQAALGLSSEDAGENMANMTHVADVLTEANNKAQGSIEEFAKALTNKAATAMRNFNIPMEEGTAVLMAFAKQGIRGEEAGEKLSIFLRDVSRAAQRNAGDFHKFGIEVFDAHGNMKNMADVVKEFEDALGPMSDSEKAGTLETLQLTRSVGDVIRTLMGTSGVIRGYEKDLRGAGGTTQDVAEKQLKTFNAQVGLLKNNLMDVAIEVGSRVVPRLVPVVQWITKRIPGAFDAAEEAFNHWRKVAEDTVASVRAFITQNWSKVQRVFKAVTDFIDRNWNNVKQTFQDVAVIIGAIILALVETVKFLWRRFGDEIMDAVVSVWNFVRNFIAGALGVIRGIIHTVASLIKGDWGEAWEGIKTIFKGALQMIVAAVRFAFETVKIIIRTAWEVIKSITFVVWTVIRTLLANVWGVIQRNVSAAARNVWGYIQGAWDSIKLYTGIVWANIKSKIATFVEWVRGIPGKISEIGSSMWDGLKSGLTSAINWILGKLESLINSAGDAANAILDLPGIPGHVGNVNLPRVGGGGGNQRSSHVGSQGRAPHMAAGGIVRHTPGGIMANIGEGRFDEAVVPLDGNALGPNEIILKIDISGGDKQFMEWMRRRIRVEGGNVQKVLGQSR